MKLSLRLNTKSIGDAIKEIEKYKERLYYKNDMFVRRLAELGIPIINSRISAAMGDSDPRHNTYIVVHSFEDYSEAKLVLEGRDILFFEFGAGIHYNGAAGDSPHPLGKEMGYTIGSYGKGYGARDSWVYRDDSGASHVSHGTQATMPMYKASLEIINNIRRIASEVYNDK